MSRLTRYILHQTLMAMLIVAVVFTAAVWLVQSLRLIDLIVNRGLSIELFLYLALLFLPRFIDVVLPIAVFIAVLYVYNRIVTDSELVVMRAAGVSPLALARPAFLAGLAAMVALAAMSVYFLPASNRAFSDLQFEIRNKIVPVMLLEGAFNTISNHVTIYIRARDNAGDLSGIVIYDDRDPQKPVTLVAERGALVDTKEGPRLLLEEGSRQIYDRGTGHLSVLSFAQYTLDLDRFRDVPEVRYHRPEELYLNELLTARPGEPQRVRHARLVELNMRLLTPLSALALAALPLACLLCGEFNRRGQTRRILLAIVLAFLFEAMDIGFKDVAVRHLAAMVPLYLNVLLPPAVTIWLLARGGGFRLRPAGGIAGGAAA
ncbi:MAG: LPS export ABC transporter permease LptF [Stellaceae bacterium]